MIVGSPAEAQLTTDRITLYYSQQSSTIEINLAWQAGADCHVPCGVGFDSV